MKNFILFGLFISLCSFGQNEKLNENDGCSVTCTATATNLETGESYSFTRRATSLSCAGAESQACALAGAAADQFIREQLNQQ
ncbi:hypothetical protein [Leeuwenhoekiella marinoflava]|uniref:Uncharacterized protein n=2 Tax=Leeuwenhoekiella marinoflava TaxID=988 RepID=A0A4Q0PQL8_9FLAO|nr:hypothetical protein [Leeuwenhoekiella marinoflava]RXG32909.1 hypothetical protein DSL99_0 [Leeuwenhoekiella marinoflava]SHE31640.1 hypothetical protein SAMN02745246_00059 [Leeuwenhoekiella marinoflava DSM 3653]